MWVKKSTPPNFCHNFVKYRPIFKILSPVTGTLPTKFAIRGSLHLKHVATLPYEILITKKLAWSVHWGTVSELDFTNTLPTKCAKIVYLKQNA